MEMTLQLLLVVISLMTITHVKAADDSDSLEKCAASMVSSLVDGPRNRQAVQDVRERLEKLGESMGQSGEADACTRGMGDDLTKWYRPYVVVDDKTVGKKILCDTETLGGGWIVIQRRAQGDLEFNTTWANYKNGFGKVRGDHWMGNEAVYQLTSKATYELRIDMRVGNQDYYAQYSSFKIGPESAKYALTLGAYSGTIGEDKTTGLTLSNGMKFSTKDNDNDQDPTGSCSVRHHGAWWYKRCHRSNLNGRWADKSYPALTGVAWCKGGTFSKCWVYPTFTEMKIRQVA